MRRLAPIALAALALTACGGSDTDTDPPGGTARASQLTECLSQADLDVRPADNKVGSSRAFTVHKSNGKRTSFVYIFEEPKLAEEAQKRLFKPKDEETVAAYTAGDTVVINTYAAADVSEALDSCFQKAS